MGLAGRLLLGFLEVAPERELSRVVGRLASLPAPVAVRTFASLYGVAVDEAEHPLDAYPSLLAFFTRRLKAGVRPVDPDPDVIVSPVDGVLDVSGRVEAGALVQAKGHRYDVAALLAVSPESDEARRYRDGVFATLYLSPRDYHRTHCPADAEVVAVRYVPGDLMPVNANAVSSVSSLFTRNERVVVELESARFGRMAYVMVGATCVGRMKLAFDARIMTNVRGAELLEHHYEPRIPLAKAAELGVFELGSTVVLVMEPGVELARERGPIRMGERLAMRMGERVARRR
jgi:phosphatidylserine decarboxylase